MDYISNLPDAIISYILSFLSTKCAVKTCILSKRWQYVWTKVPALDFTEMPRSHRYLSDEQQIHFKNFVNKVLLQNDVSCLRCFTFSSSSEYDYDYIESWLRAVEGREFCELNVKLDCPETFYLPRRFLSCQRLVVLKLEGFMISNMGHSFHLPNLEIIHLVSIVFDGDLFLKSLILDCTALKELLIEGCYGFDETLYVESSTLESLEIKESAIDRSNYVLPFIRIKTPNLRYLSLQDALANYDIGELKLLTEANLDLWDSEGYDDIEHHALQLIEKVSGVKSLRLGRTDVVCCFEDAIPNFENLIELKLAADFVIYELLECAPKLKSLIIEEVDFVGESFYSKVAPGCMSCLENVEIFLDKRHHIRLAEHILKVATALKKMTVYLHPATIKKGRAVYQSLLNLPRSSPICQVKVVHLD